MALSVYAGWLSVVLALANPVLYLFSIFSQRAKPHLFSWIVWSLLVSISCVAQVDGGGGLGAYTGFALALSNILIACLAVFFGEWSITRADWIFFLAALCAIPLWILSGTSVWSVVLVCVIDTLGYFPTVRKAWYLPFEEPILPYLSFGLATLVSLFAIEQLSISTALYPAVLSLSNLGLSLYLMLRRKKFRFEYNAPPVLPHILRHS